MKLQRAFCAKDRFFVQAISKQLAHVRWPLLRASYRKLTVLAEDIGIPFSPLTCAPPRGFEHILAIYPGDLRVPPRAGCQRSALYGQGPALRRTWRLVEGVAQG